MTTHPTLNDNHRLTPYDEFLHVTRIIRRREDCDPRANALLIWMVEQTSNLTNPVAITIHPTSLVYKIAGLCTEAVHTMYSQFGTGRLGNVSLCFSARVGCGYRRGSLGIPIYYQDDAGDKHSSTHLHTIWLSRHPFGHLPSAPDKPGRPSEPERVRLLDTSDWLASMSAGQLEAARLF